MSSCSQGPRRAVASFAGAVLCVLFVGAAGAQGAAVADTVVVTATRSPLPLSQVLADMSVLERDAIERSGASCVADLLARLPGVEFSRNGGPGTVTGVFVRGGESRHTAVFIDGVRVDSQATGGAMWEMLPVEQVERIELLRGPAAAIYGSDAVGGVVQIITRQGKGAPRATAAVTMGAKSLRQGQVSLAGAAGPLDYALSASHGRSDGFNARPIATANPDIDGWRRDGGRTTDDVSDYALRTATLGWSSHWAAGSDTRVTVGQSRSTYETQPSYYRSETTLRNFLLRHEELVAGQHLSVSLERRDDHLLNPATAFAATLEGERTQDAVALGWRTDIGAHGLQAHLRYDDDSEFGGEGTGSLAWGWNFAPGFRVTASAATSFRAPTLYQRFSEYGTATLQPEAGRNVEAGLRWAQGGHELSATVWRNRLRQLIAFGAAGPCASTFGCYENIGRAQYEGVTLSGRTTLAGWALIASVDWHDPRNLDTGLVLVRRARKLANLGVQTTWGGWLLGVDVQAADARFDNTANTQRMGGYALVNLSVAKPLGAGLVLEGRIDNALDKAYEVARTYANARRAAQITLRWTMP
jgi:vitamin B12 transporter